MAQAEGAWRRGLVAGVGGVVAAAAVVRVGAAWDGGGASSGGVAGFAGAPGTGLPYDIEDLATAFLRLSGGATLLLESSWVTHSNAGDDFGVVCYGTESGAEIKVEDYNWQDTLRIYTDVAGVPAETRPQLTRGEGHLAMVREFISAITQGNWSAHNGTDGLYRARIVDACYVSPDPPG